MLLSLADIVKKYKYFEIAQEQDSPELLNFFNDVPMSTKSVNVHFSREPNFFNLLKRQGHLSWVVVGRGQDKKISFVASIICRETYINGQKQRLAYFSDLRLKPSKTARGLMSSWKLLMAEIVDKSQVIQGLETEYILTAILSENERALSSLTKKKTNQFVYNKIESLNMVNILGGIKSYSGPLKVERGNLSIKSEVFNFYKEQLKLKSFGYTSLFIKQALMHWPELSMKDFIVVRKKCGAIVACTALWSPSRVKKTMVTNLSWPLKVLRRLVMLVKTLPNQGEELKIIYLLFLQFGGEVKLDALKAILFYLKKESLLTDYHITAFAESLVEPINLKQFGLITTKTPISVFQVLSRSKVETLAIEPLQKSSGFEIALT